MAARIGDQFDIPEGAVPIGASAGCPNQGFVLEDRVVGLQFHLEMTRGAVGDFIEQGGEELDESDFVQSPEELLAADAPFEECNRLMSAVLRRVLGQP